MSGGGGATGGGAALGARAVLAIALPVALSNVTTPLQGAVDVAVVGGLGAGVYLAAAGLGAQVFTLLIGALNFLQIGTSGLTAQALGARDPARVIETLARALLVAALLGLALVAGQGALIWAGMRLFDASPEAERLAAAYFAVRIWAAPAELANGALMGWFSGQALTRRLLIHQVAISAANIGLSLLFVVGLGYGIEGVAAGTLLAAWFGLAVGLALARTRAAALAPPGWRLRRAAVLHARALARLATLNRDIFIRTLCLIGAFAWMTRLGAQQGDAMLAANIVLWQFFEISAYLLDGFAIAAEALTGQAAGARDPRRFRRAAVATSLWSGALAVAASGLLLAAHGPLIDLFTTAPDVRALAREHAFWAALTPAVGFAAFQLDGIFVGAAAARAMRDAMLLSAGLFAPVAWVATATLGNHGLWAAMLAFLALRAAALLARYPALEAGLAEAPRAAAGVEPGETLPGGVAG